MSDLAVSPLSQQPVNTLAFITETPRLLHLELLITDNDSITELLQQDEGAARNDYAVSALRVGLLSLRHARGQIDVESVKREGDRMLADLKQALEFNRIQMNQSLASSLREYFDPSVCCLGTRFERAEGQEWLQTLEILLRQPYNDLAGRGQRGNLYRQ